MKANRTAKTAGRQVAATVPMPSPPSRYEPTPQESSAAERLRERRQQETPAPRFKIDHADGIATISADHPDPSCAYTLLADALGTGDVGFAQGLLNQLASASRTGKELTAGEVNFMMATIRGIAPRDATEALLATQMAAIHNATMMAARRLNHIETIDQQDLASNMLNKLARTFASQIDALKRYRATGEQNVRVTHQHVSVTAGQAVVGINPGGGGTYEKSRQSHAPSETGQSGPSLLRHEQAVPLPLPGTGGEGQECVSDARSARRSTDRQG